MLLCKYENARMWAFNINRSRYITTNEGAYNINTYNISIYNIIIERFYNIDTYNIGV